MRHVILTCKNHPNLRWSCKEIAFDGHYNGLRKLTFDGIPTGKGMYSDGSGLYCTRIQGDSVIDECTCKADCLILAPEDSAVKKEEPWPPAKKDPTL